MLFRSGAVEAESALVERARKAHLSLAAYRKALHLRYLRIMANQRG